MLDPLNQTISIDDITLPVCSEIWIDHRQGSIRWHEIQLKVFIHIILFIEML